jgi:hypothetical protein
MEKKLSEILDVSTYLFKTAKRVRNKCGKYACVSDAVRALEDAAFENMCGTSNVHYGLYLECFYKGVISIDELIHHLAFPLKEDADEGVKNEAAEGYYDE